MSDRLPPENQRFAIVVKPKHFATAERASATRCLIASALRDTFPDLKTLYVNSLGLFIKDEEARPEQGKGDLYAHDAFKMVLDYDLNLLHKDHFPPEGVVVRFVPQRPTQMP